MMPRLANRWGGAARWLLLRADGRLHRVQLRLCLLSASPCAGRVHSRPVFVGVGGGSFGVYMLWLPEQYRTECRGSAFAFANSIGRFAAAGATFLVGAGISAYGSMGIPVAPPPLAFALGLLAVPFGVETKGKPLPA